VGITNGSGIGLSVSGNTLTVSNTGVLSIDGSTGAISNVARTNVNNNFSAPQTISTTDPELVLDNTDNGNRTTFLSNSVLFSNIPGSLDQYLYASPTSPPNTITLPDFSTTLAGLAGTQTFTGTNTFSSLANFNAGISSAGGTFSALTRFTAGISASGATFSGNISAPNIVNSFNGLTGAVTGVTTGTANTFGPLQSFTNGISAAGGTFSSPIRIPKLPHLTSAVFESKTSNWTPTDADNGKIFVVNISGKSTITCTLNGLSVGVSFKIFVESGSVTFSVTGTGYGQNITFGLSAVASTTIYCTATNTYFSTNSG
jgi:hypothetical protein